MQDDVDDDVSCLYDHPVHVMQYNQLWLSSDENWQEFIQHMHLGVPWDDEEQAEEQAAAPHAGDKLWEIGCKVCNYPSPKMLLTQK